MNISVCMVYYAYAEQFKATLNSYLNNHPGIALEVVVVEEHKNAANKKLHDGFLEIAGAYSRGKSGIDIIWLEDTFIGSHNPAPKLNMAIKKASNDIVIITSPSVVHNGGNIFIDAEINLTRKPRQWISYACKSREDASGWYQHSTYNSRALHYCAATTKSCWEEIGGFDERYSNYLGWEDNDLIRTMIKKEVPITQIDAPFCTHLDHPRGWGLTPKQVQQKIRMAQETFKAKWGDDRLVYFAEPGRVV